MPSPSTSCTTAPGSGNPVRLSCTSPVSRRVRGGNGRGTRGAVPLVCNGTTCTGAASVGGRDGAVAGAVMARTSSARKPRSMRTPEGQHCSVCRSRWWSQQGSRARVRRASAMCAAHRRIQSWNHQLRQGTAWLHRQSTFGGRRPLHRRTIDGALMGGSYCAHAYEATNNSFTPRKLSMRRFT